MTLIQTVVTGDFVMQVSDRRLTKGLDRNKSVVVDDEDATKLVCWNNNFTAGFTGLARMDRRQTEPTALWIAKVLSECPTFEYGLDALRLAAQKQIKLLPKLWDRRLAIVIVGFDLRGTPLLGQVSNFDTTTGRSTDLDAFRGVGLSMNNQSAIAVHSAGAILPEINQTVLARYIPRLLRKPDGKSGTGINRAIRTMVQNQRLVARKEKTVGEDALCVFIPKVQATFPGGPNVSFVLSNLGGPDVPTGTSGFGFFDKRGWRFEQRAPLITAYGMGVTEQTGRADPDFPDNQTIGFRFHKLPTGWT